MIGYSADALAGKSVIDFIEAQSLEHTMFVGDVLAYTGYVEDIPVRYITKEQGLFSAMITVTASFLDDASIAFYDVLVERVSEEQYEQNLKQFSQGIFSMGIHPDEVGVIVIDNERRITGMNPYAQRLTGWSFERAKGKLAKQVYTTIYERTQLNCPPPGLVAMNIGRPTQTQANIILTDRRGVPHAIKHFGDLAKDANGRTMGGIQFFVLDEQSKSKSFEMPEDQYMKL